VKRKAISRCDVLLAEEAMPDLSPEAWERVLHQDAYNVLKLTAAGDVVELTLTHFPSVDRDKNVKTVVRLTPSRAEAFRLRSLWHGSGREDVAVVELTSSEYEALREEMAKASRLRDLDRLISTLKRMQDRECEKCFMMVQEVVSRLSKLEELRQVAEILERERNNPHFAEYLRCCIWEYLNDP